MARLFSDQSIAKVDLFPERHKSYEPSISFQVKSKEQIRQLIMPGNIKKSDGPDPDPSPWLSVSPELKIKLKAKPYDPKKSCWSVILKMVTFYILNVVYSIGSS